MALVLKELGDYPGAKKLLEIALKSAKKHFDSEHPTIVTRYHNLAVVLIDLKDYKQALSYENKALKILEKHLPENHPYIEITKKHITFLKEHQ